MSEAFELLMPKPDQAQRSKHGLTAPDEEDFEWEDVAAKDAADSMSVALTLLVSSGVQQHEMFSRT